MAMTSRERMLTALENGRPDRLPCQVHGWMSYYLENYLDGIDRWQAYEKFDMDYAIYVSPAYTYDDKDLADWSVEVKDTGTDSSGNRCETVRISTPEAFLTKKRAHTDITSYDTEYLIKDMEDFEAWNKYYPVPVGVDFTPIQKAKDRLGDNGIILYLFPATYSHITTEQRLCRTTFQ